MYNSTGVHFQFGVNYYYDVEWYKQALSDDEFHRSTNQGITGIVNEIPGFSREDWTNEYFAELTKLIEEAEVYIAKYL